MSNDDVHEVRRIWGELVGWLEVFAPVNGGALAGGAQSGEIAAAERVLGRELPGELAAVLRATDGVRASEKRENRSGVVPEGNFFYSGGRHLLPARLIPEVHAYQVQRGIESGDPGYWRPEWIPFAVDEEWLFGIFLDASTGTVGTWSDYGEVRQGAWPSLAAFLEMTLASLGQAQVADGALEEF